MTSIHEACRNAAPIIETDGKAIVLDLSIGSHLRETAIAGLDVEQLGTLINACMADAATDFAFGRYGEPRDLYTNEHFAASEGEEQRTIHMGVDLFCRAGTPIQAPLAGKVELLADNARELDYGPLVVLRHEQGTGEHFFTLYGHLGPDVFDRLQPGQLVVPGEQIASVGSPPQNGNWPPHLHLQVILDLLDHGVDFPGVALRSEQKYWLGLSPSPAPLFPECDPRELEYAQCN